jgi:hypothetical protein
VAVTLVYPNSAEINMIAQDKMARLTADRPVFDFFPIRTQDAWNLLWEQLDTFIGLQQVRGLNGMPQRVKPVALYRYEMEPGVYGEHMALDEAMIAKRRVPGTMNQPINVEDLVLEKQDQLLLRRIDRIEQIIWALVSTGTFAVPGPAGAILHTDTFPLQTYTASIPWSNAATSTPLADFSNVQIKRRGHSVSFGADSRCYLNRSTYNALRLNGNSTDLYGRRTQGLGTINNLPTLNSLLMGDDLPQVVIYDEGYYDDNSVFQLFIPTGTAILIGRRPAGQVVGEYRMVRNAVNPDLAPGPYMKIIDRRAFEVPGDIEIHDGHNGGPVIYFGSAIVQMNGLI